MPWPINARMIIYRTTDFEQQLEFKDMSTKEYIDFTGYSFYCPLKESLEYTSTLGEFIVDETRKEEGILVLTSTPEILSGIISDKIYATLYRIDDATLKKDIYMTIECIVEDAS